MKKYLRNLEKIEFVLTDACTGRCKHCSEGDHDCSGAFINPEVAKRAVREVAEKCSIKTVMVFGGEPLLYPEAAAEIIRTATELGIPRRQIITNGYFTKSDEVRRRVAEMLAEAGVNDLLLSVDAFHQEHIPLSEVRRFLENIIEAGVPVRLQPAWLVSPTDESPYNSKTRKILAGLADLGTPVGEGNTVFPEGNALKYLSEYFKDGTVKNPYVDDPRDVRCLSISPHGDVLDGNIYKNGIAEIMEKYAPREGGL